MYNICVMRCDVVVFDTDWILREKSAFVQCKKSDIIIALTYSNTNYQAETVFDKKLNFTHKKTFIALRQSAKTFKIKFSE